MPAPIFAFADLWTSLWQPLLLALFLALFPLGTFSHQKAINTPRWRLATGVFALVFLLGVPASVVKSAFERGAVAAGSDHPVLIGYAAGFTILLPTLAVLFILLRRFRSQPV
ncbi:MAG: hypothetical protein ACREEY_02460 [Brevundimonas sp.]